MKKGIIVFLAALFLLNLLSGCSGTSPAADKPKTDESAAGEGTSYADFMKTMKDIKGYGDQMAEIGMTVQSEYYYSFAGASTSALRYAAEYILWLKGEGDTLSSFTSDSRYTGWSRIAEINYSSPYPAYFEGLLLEIQGKYEESEDPYAWSSIMPMFPEEGLDFYYLKKMDTDSLYALRDQLRELEDSIYTVYHPVITGREWDRCMFDKEYLLGCSSDHVKSGDYPEALYYAETALKIDPFDAAVWQNAAFCSFCCSDLGRMGAYMDEALVIFPDDENLNALKQSMLDAAQEMEGGK